MNTAPKISEERLKVIDNIAEAVKEKNTFKKVELHDPFVTDEMIKQVIIPFDNLKRHPINRIKADLAILIGEHLTRKLNKNTVIVGLENALSIKGGAILTSNHFNVMDNTIIRVLCAKCKRARKLSVVIQHTNVFMKGLFGFLLKNGYTLPVAPSVSYMAKNFKPAVKKLLGKGRFVLIYPEAEMWFNYKKPREGREGAYQIACECGVPVLPCFVEMRECEGYAADGMRNVRHILHVLPPIYPDTSISAREARAKMQKADTECKQRCYEEVYGIPLDDEFIPERDIAGYHK